VVGASASAGEPDGPETASDACPLDDGPATCSARTGNSVLAEADAAGASGAAAVANVGALLGV
jgi:hypothetical protein